MHYSCVVINGRFLEQKITGVQRFALETTKALDEFAPQSPVPYILAVPPSVPDSVIPALKNIKVERPGTRSGILWEQTQLVSYLKKKKAIVINLCSVTTLLYRHALVCLHDICYTMHPDFVSSKNKLVRAWHMLQDKSGAKKSLHILTVSNFSKKEIVEYYKLPEDKVTVVYNGWQHFSPEIANDNFAERFDFLKDGEYFYTMSTLKKNKNFKWILENAKYNPDITYAVAGKIDAKKFGTTADEYEAPNIHYLGYVSDEEAKLLMKHAKAFVFPSLYEGFGIPPLEALAMGTPVICSNATCLPEIFEDTVHYIDPLNAHVKLDAVLESPVSDAGKLLTKYSWQNTAKVISEAVVNCVRPAF